MSAPLAEAVSTCALCPRLCRSACPVVTGAGREAATPSLIAAVLLDLERGRVSAAEAARAVTLCTDCGGCQDHCHIHRPLPQLLREARARLGNPPPIEPLRPIEGEGDLVAVESDDRPLADALAAALERPVRRWPTSDRLGVGAIEHDAWARHAATLRRHLGDREAVVIDGGVAAALDAAGLRFRWLHQVVEGLPLGIGSCVNDRDRPLACCGAAGPLGRAHPDDAVRVGQVFLARATGRRVDDARCRAHLRACGAAVDDPLDALLALQRRS